jgi:hypothetical protein
MTGVNMATRRPASGESISTRRWPTIAGTSIAVLTVLAYVGLVVNGATTMIPSEDLDESYVAGSLWMLSWVPFGLVGGLLVARRPTHPVGWLMAVIALPIMLTVTLDAVATEAAARGWTGGWIPWTAWSASWIYAPVFPGLGLLLASFPTGRIGNRLLSKLAPIQYASIVGIAVLRGLRPGLTDTEGVHSPIDLPLSRELFDPAIGVVTGVTVVFFLIAGIDLVVRYVRARGVERAQLKWFAASFGFLVGAFVLLAEVLRPLLGEAFGHEVGEIIEILPFTLGLGGMATAIGVAVLRYRLFEIDRAVSRTVSYVLLTALLVGVYAAGVLGVGALVPGERSDLLVAASTLAVAALFRPMRSRTQRLVDRRFNRARYDAARTVEAFGARLRDEVDTEALQRELREVVQSTFGSSQVGTWPPNEVTT